jgi:hypothetical protein
VFIIYDTLMKQAQPDPYPHSFTAVEQAQAATPMPGSASA